MEKPIGKSVSNIQPLEGLLTTLDMMKDSILGKDVSSRDSSMTDEVGDITIDTCLTSDTGVWETGIKRESIEGVWVIVSQYESDEEAKTGHAKWTEYMEKEPTAELRDINMWNLPEDDD